jgi:hypothetical protein
MQRTGQESQTLLGCHTLPTQGHTRRCGRTKTMAEDMKEEIDMYLQVYTTTPIDYNTTQVTLLAIINRRIDFPNHPSGKPGVCCPLTGTFQQWPGTKHTSKQSHLWSPRRESG